MMFPKPKKINTRKAKNNKRAPKGSMCFVCGTTYDIHTHEVFFGANRQLSIKYGMQVFLCGKHHNMSTRGVHFDKSLDNKLKKQYQSKFKEMYPNLDFVKIFGENYL